MKTLRKNILGINIFLLALIASSYTYASTCILTTKPVVKTKVITLATDPRVNVGEELGLITNSDLSGMYLTVGCTGGSTPYRSLAPLTASTTVPGVYETGIAGVGLTVTDLWAPARLVPYSTSIAPGPLTPWHFTENVKIRFIKTGPINIGGSIGAKSIARYYLNNDVVAEMQLGGLKVIQKSCLVELNSKNQTIDLGGPRRSEFTGVGSTAPSSERNFKVVLECQADNIPVQISFDPVGTSSGDGMINISKDIDAASGVVVEVLDSGRNPIKFGAQKTYHSASELNIEIPMYARYKQNGNIIPGKANAAMTFTITQN